MEGLEACKSTDATVEGEVPASSAKSNGMYSIPGSTAAKKKGIAKGTGQAFTTPLLVIHLGFQPSSA